MSHEHDLTELVTVIGASNVRCLDQLLPFPADALDGRLPKTNGRLYSTASKLHDVEEEKTTSDHPATSKCLLSCCLPFFCTYFTQVLVQS